MSETPLPRADGHEPWDRSTERNVRRWALLRVEGAEVGEAEDLTAADVARDILRACATLDRERDELATVRAEVERALSAPPLAELHEDTLDATCRTPGCLGAVDHPGTCYRTDRERELLGSVDRLIRQREEITLLLLRGLADGISPRYWLREAAVRLGFRTPEEQNAERQRLLAVAAEAQAHGIARKGVDDGR